MYREAQGATVHGVAKNQTWLSYWACSHERTGKGLLWTLVSLAWPWPLPGSWQTSSVANNTGRRLKVVFSQAHVSRSTPGLCWWLLPYRGKISVSLDQGSVCGAWGKSGSRDVSVVEEARLVYYIGLEVKGEEKVKIIYEGLFHTYRFCVLVFGCLSISFFFFFNILIIFCPKFPCLFYFATVNRVYLELFLCDPLKLV